MIVLIAVVTRLCCLSLSHNRLLRPIARHYGIGDNHPLGTCVSEIVPDTNVFAMLVPYVDFDILSII